MGPRVWRGPSSLWLGGNHSSLLCKVFAIQIKVELVWENSVSQKPVIGACGDINTHGEFMGSFVAAFKETFCEFLHEALRARLPAAVGPGQAGRRRVFSWVTRPPCVEGGTLKQLRRPAFLSRCAAWFLPPPGTHLLCQCPGATVTNTVTYGPPVLEAEAEDQMWAGLVPAEASVLNMWTAVSSRGPHMIVPLCVS